MGEQVMLYHVGIASTEEEIDKLKQVGLEFIAEEQLRREKATGQLSLSDVLKTNILPIPNIFLDYQ